MALFRFSGVNLPSYAFGTNLPGVYANDYIMPDTQTLDYFQSKGLNTVQLSLQWERVCPYLTTPEKLDEAYLARVDQYLSECERRRLQCILTVRTFAEYRVGGKTLRLGSEIPSHQFAEFWHALAKRYASSPVVSFDLMNEPKGQQTITSELWRSCANAAIAAINETSFEGYVFVCGNGYSGAAAWNSTWYGTPNSVEMLKLYTKPTVALNVHSYWDADGSGEYKTGDVTSADAGVKALTPVVEWARKNKRKFILGEFGTTDTPLAWECTKRALQYLSVNRDVCLGWSYWAAGPWWQPGSAPGRLSIEPDRVGGQLVEKNQVKWLQGWV